MWGYGGVTWGVEVEVWGCGGGDVGGGGVRMWGVEVQLCGCGGVVWGVHVTCTGVGVSC